MSRSGIRKTIKNDLPFYKNLLDKRGRRHIRMLETAEFSKLQDADLSNLTFVDHVVTVGDKMSKLSHRFYGDVQFWWVIATFNNKPTDGHLELGDIISIPLPLNEALTVLDPGLNPGTY